MTAEANLSSKRQSPCPSDCGGRRTCGQWTTTPICKPLSAKRWRRSFQNQKRSKMAVKQNPTEAARQLAADLLAGRITIEEALSAAVPAPPRAQRTRGVAQPYLRGEIWWIQYNVDGKRYR